MSVLKASSLTGKRCSGLRGTQQTCTQSGLRGGRALDTGGVLASLTSFGWAGRWAGTIPFYVLCMVGGRMGGYVLLLRKQLHRRTRHAPAHPPAHPAAAAHLVRWAPCMHGGPLVLGRRSHPHICTSCTPQHNDMTPPGPQLPPAPCPARASREVVPLGQQGVLGRLRVRCRRVHGRHEGAVQLAACVHKPAAVASGRAGRGMRVRASQGVKEGTATGGLVISIVPARHCCHQTIKGSLAA